MKTLSSTLLCLLSSLILRPGVAFTNDKPLSSSGWTPVVGSKLVELPNGYIEEPQRPVKISKEVPPNDNNSRIGIIQESPQALVPQEGSIVREEEVQASLLPPATPREKPQINEAVPFIIYPEGTFPTQKNNGPPSKSVSSSSTTPPPPPPVQRLPDLTGRPILPRLPPRPNRVPPPPPPPVRSRQAPPRPLPPRRRPPPPPRRPGPPRRGPPSKSGIAGIGSSISCFTEDVAADYRLSDKNYMQAQIKCVLNEGPCDKVGGAIKRLAPEIFRGRCPHPCNPCKKKQIQKIMARVSKEYPYEWTQMIKIFG
eukprot:TRINITY_DN2128_c0_g1_i1.p1 TRINITY_DN2128_c0_g1~~TRINITY_DN2128_c0_g1_i1.p1  ORF type:complete len:311 (+),score=73.29 TRINITY_DN2128_c0_g1_i1:238-1170(+)